MRLNLLIFMTLFIGQSTFALEADRAMPITIEAHRVDIDKAGGVSTYRGNVTLRQGSLTVRADAIRVEAKDKKVQRVLAEGQPASFRQRPDNATEDVQAEAKHVEYLAPKGLVLLKGEAHLLQGGNHFTGDAIEYLVREDKVKAQAKPGGDRVQVVIQPDSGK